MNVIPRELLFMCKVFGVFPVRYRHELRKRKWKHFNVHREQEIRLSFSPALCLWGVTLVSVQVAFSLFALCTDFYGMLHRNPIKMTSTTAIFAVILDIASLSLSVVVSVIRPTLYHETLIGVYENLAIFDSNLGISCRQRYVKGKIVLLFGCMTFVITLYSLNSLIENFTLYRLYIPFVTLFYNNCAISFHFYYIVREITERIRIANHFIKQEIVKSVNIGERQHLIELNRGNIGFGVSSSGHKIRSLIELYWLLCEAVHQANSFYSCQLLVAVFSSFIHIVITLYYFFLHIWPTINFNEIPYLVMQGLWIAVHVTHLVLLIWPSTAVTEAADETAPMICKTMNRDLNPEIKKQLETFLLQLLHHNARFSALGFFDIHSHILTSMAGSVTTYLVILIQFQTAPVPVQPSPAMAAPAAALPGV